MREARRRFILQSAGAAVLGLILQIWLASRGAIGGDQYVLLDLGLDYIEGKELSPFGKGMSGGGFIPGALLQILIGVPLTIWRDYRAPVILIGLFHLAALFFLMPVLWRGTSERVALAYLVVWWLSPWRLYHSGILWEPAYVILPAAVHLWACWRLREQPGAVPSAALAAAMVCAFQLHGSFLFLVILTMILLLRRLVRIRPLWGLAGAAAGSLTLIPTGAALVAGTLPSPAPSQSFFGYGLFTVAPLLKTLLYWFRLGSLDVGRRITSVVFLDSERAAADAAGRILQAAAAAVAILAVLSVLIALAATIWLFKRGRREEGREEEWLWLRSYAKCGFIALLISSALSPVTIQSWHVLIALPTASLPVALWMASAAPAGKRWLRLALILFIVLRVPEVILIGYGSRAYRMDPQIASKLQERQRTLLPERLRSGY